MHALRSFPWRPTRQSGTALKTVTLDVSHRLWHIEINHCIMLVMLDTVSCLIVLFLIAGRQLMIGDLTIVQEKALHQGTNYFYAFFPPVPTTAAGGA